MNEHARRAQINAKNYRLSLLEKNKEKAEKVKAQNKLKVLESQLKRYKSKEQSVRELRRNANVVATLEESRDRAEER